MEAFNFACVMIILRGAPSHSEFRLQKLVSELKAADLPVQGLYAEFAHAAEIDGELSSDEKGVLEKLLTYGPKLEEHCRSPPGNAFSLVFKGDGHRSHLWTGEAGTRRARGCVLGGSWRGESG